jgi:hypothetical protein
MILALRFQVRNPALFLDLVIITNDMMESKHRQSAEPGNSIAIIKWVKPAYIFTFFLEFMRSNYFSAEM